MSKTYLVPPNPPHNEGKTVAAWTFAALVVLGCIGVALGMVFGETLYLWIGLGVIVLGLILGYVLRLMGHGQKTRA